MCETYGTSIRSLYEQVHVLMPGEITPVSFQIWSCKFVNFLYVLHMNKQPSLAWRRTLPQVQDDEAEQSSKRRRSAGGA